AKKGKPVPFARARVRPHAGTQVATGQGVSTALDLLTTSETATAEAAAKPRRSFAIALYDLLARPLETRQVACAFGIILLNLVDATGTLANVSRGATELNPLMSVLLGTGDARFVVVKHLLASIGVAGMLLHPHVRAARTALAVL